MRVSRKKAEQYDGKVYRIDDTCYPPLMYRGDRFKPIVLLETYTELETELLEACEEVCKWVEFVFGSQFAGEPAHRKAREAIKKAKEVT